MVPCKCVCLINKFFFQYVFTLSPFPQVLRSWPYSEFSAAKYASLKDQESKIIGFGSTFVSHSSYFGLNWEAHTKSLISTHLIQEQERHSSFPPGPWLISGHRAAKLQYFVLKYAQAQVRLLLFMHGPSESNPLILTNIFLQSNFSVAKSLAIP